MGYSRLAFGCVSDAVSLMFSEEATPEEIERLDLFAVSEIKRKKNGDIEIKFFDRLKALDKLRELSTGSDPAAMTLYSAIEQGAKALREDKHV